jgi:hypothetical protein
MHERPDSTPLPNPCAAIGGTVDDLRQWAASLPLDPWGERLYRVVEQLVRDLEHDCERAEP